jgi:hypothetical protein
MARIPWGWLVQWLLPSQPFHPVDLVPNQELKTNLTSHLGTVKTFDT